MNKQQQTSFLRVALRAKWIDLGGVLTGCRVKARPPSGLEHVAYLDEVRGGSTARAILGLLRDTLIEWDLRDEAGNALPLTAETLQGLTNPALNALQDAIDPLIADVERDEEAFLASAKPSAT
jgi:hypothetical protein